MRKQEEERWKQEEGDEIWRFIWTPIYGYVSRSIYGLSSVYHDYSILFILRPECFDAQIFNIQLCWSLKFVTRYVQSPFHTIPLVCWCLTCNFTDVKKWKVKRKRSVNSNHFVVRDPWIWFRFKPVLDAKYFGEKPFYANGTISHQAYSIIEAI